MADRIRTRDLEEAVKAMVMVSVGDQLSTSRFMENGSIIEKPSVILARDTSVNGKTAPPPKYPFVMVSQSQQQKVATVLNRWLDEPEEGVFDKVQESAVVVRIGIKVFGTPQDSVEDIASDLDQSFAAQDYQALIESLYGEDCAFTQTSDLVSVASSINNVYQEVTTFDAYFSIVREYRQKNVGVINEIDTPEQNLLHVDGNPIQ